MLALTDEVIEKSFRDAAIKGDKRWIWVIFDRGSELFRPAQVRFDPKADVRC